MVKKPIGCEREEDLYEHIFEPGQIFTMSFYDLSDGHFFDEMRIRELGLDEVVRRIQNSKIKVPGIVVRKIYTADFVPYTVDVYIFNRWRSNLEISGALCLTDIMIWRYVDDITEVQQWTLDMAENIREKGDSEFIEGIALENVHYIEKQGNTYYKVYPFLPSESK